MPNACPADLIDLYTRAVVCQRFPAYKLEELKGAPAGDILRALDLLSLADQARSQG
jgi:hypothetical protein